MTDLAVALGLMLVIEGAMYALFPDAMKRMTAQIALLAPQQLRTAGLVLAGLGFLTVALVRGMP